MKILLLGEDGNHCLETSYRAAFTELGHEAVVFDTLQSVMKYARPGWIGKKLHRFFPVEAWLKKSNKDIVNFALEYKPDLIMAFTNAEVLPGTFMYLKSLLPVKIVWYWADPLYLLNKYILQSVTVTDMLATYSSNTINVFAQAGSKKTIWLPFAADLSAHFEPVTSAAGYDWDVSFVGTWRPEREHAFSVLNKKIPGIRLKIYGPYWNRVQDKALKKYITAKPCYGKEFTDVVKRSLVNLNVMDKANYPAVNMRFFEIAAAGGLQLCNSSPEIEHLFNNREHVLFYKNDEEMCEQVQYAMNNKEVLAASRQKLQSLVTAQHLYKHRAAELLQALS